MMIDELTNKWMPVMKQFVSNDLDNIPDMKEKVRTAITSLEALEEVKTDINKSEVMRNDKRRSNKDT